MKRLAFAVACALILMLGSQAAYAGATGSDQGTGGAQSPPSTQNGGGVDATQHASVTVPIRNSTFVPHDLTVAIGTTVTWVNQDTIAHTVTSSVNGGPASGTLQPGQSFSFTFSHSGTFPYHCFLHPSEEGTVLVNTGPAQAQSTPPSSSAPNGTSPPAQSTPPSNSSSSSSSSGNNTVINNTNTNVNQSTSGNPAAAPAPPAMNQPTQPPPQDNGPSNMPNTGAAGAVTAFASTVVIGSGLGYLYLRRKLGQSS